MGIHYFDSIGYPCPKLSNPADYFMKIMNPESILMEMYEKNQGANIDVASLGKTDFLTEKFNERVIFFSESFKKHELYNQMETSCHYELPKDSGLNMTSWGNQFSVIFWRNVIEQIRNPFQIRVKIAQTIVFGVLLIVLYNDVREDIV
jgi:hypothetical protein